jgi:Lrp/AsnC family leucine-responsive transcriptional regulator
MATQNKALVASYSIAQMIGKERHMTEISSLPEGIDRIDAEILTRLQIDGQTTNIALSRQINLSPAATHARVRRLEEEGFIRRYVALVDQEKLGFDITCFVSVSLQLHQQHDLETFHATIGEIPEILECHHVTGEFDYLLRVVVRGRKDLQRLIVNHLTPIPGVARIHTSIALSEVKSTTALPIYHAPADSTPRGVSGPGG